MSHSLGLNPTGFNSGRLEIAPGYRTLFRSGHPFLHRGRAICHRASPTSAQVPRLRRQADDVSHGLDGERRVVHGDHRPASGAEKSEPETVGSDDANHPAPTVPPPPAANATTGRGLGVTRWAI